MTKSLEAENCPDLQYNNSVSHLVPFLESVNILPQLLISW